MAEPNCTTAPPPALSNPQTTQLQTPNTRKVNRLNYMQKFMSPTDAITSPCSDKVNHLQGVKMIKPKSTLVQVPEAKSLQF